jgi:hypothetical protein
MMVERIKNEPVLVTALVQALLIAGVNFGLDLSDGQQASILGLAAAVLALVARSQVTPSRTVDLATKG